MPNLVQHCPLYTAANIYRVPALHEVPDTNRNASADVISRGTRASASTTRDRGRAPTSRAAETQAPPATLPAYPKRPRDPQHLAELLRRPALSDLGPVEVTVETLHFHSMTLLKKQRNSRCVSDPSKSKKQPRAISTLLTCHRPSPRLRRPPLP